MGVNLVRNGDWSRGDLTHWWGADIDLVETGASGHYGRYTLRIWAYNGYRGYLNPYDVIPTVAGRTYCIQTRYYKPEGVYWSLWATPCNRDNRYLPGVVDVPVRESGEWTIGTAYIRPPPGSTGIQLAAECTIPADTETYIEIDWISVYEVDVPVQPETIQLADVDVTNPDIDTYVLDAYYCGGSRGHRGYIVVDELTGTDVSLEVYVQTLPWGKETAASCYVYGPFTGSDTDATYHVYPVADWIRVQYVLTGTACTRCKFRVWVSLQ